MAPAGRGRLGPLQHKEMLEGLLVHRSRGTGRSLRAFRLLPDLAEAEKASLACPVLAWSDQIVVSRTGRVLGRWLVLHGSNGFPPIPLLTEAG